MTTVGLAFVLAAATVLSAPATAADKPEDRAQAAAESWLKLLDEGRYDTSWDEAAALFRGAVTKEQWKQAATGAREPLGTLVTRKLKSRQRARQLPGAPDGDYVVIQFEAVFAHKKAAVETVTPALEKDGNWRVSGYFVR